MKKIASMCAAYAVAFGLAFSAQAETCTDCITFTGEKPFTVNMYRGDACDVAPKLQWSTNREDWATFDLSTPGLKAAEDSFPAVKTADGKYVFYVRGSGNSALASDAWDVKEEYLHGDEVANVFEIKGDNWIDDPVVSVSGNVETLLDWQTVKNGGQPEMGDYAFYYLFCGSALTSAADLVLPATKLTPYCYAGMFYSCSLLTDLPALSATTLDEGCYQMTFAGCASLVVNTNGAGRAWSIPAAAATSAAAVADWNEGMFFNAGGNLGKVFEEDGVFWSYDVVPGTNYYVASAAMPFEVHVTGAVATNCYTGVEQKLGGFTFASTKDGFTADDFVFTGVSNLVGTAAGTYKMNLTASDFALAAGSSFKDATFVVDQDGELVITQRVATLTSASQTWPYDGAAHSAATVEATGFVDGEGVTCGDFASVTGPDETVQNTFTYAAKDGTDLANYAIAVNYGTITVLPLAKSTVTPQVVEHATFKVYTNGVEVASPYVVLQGAAVTVVYVADAGYEFGFNQSTAEAAFTADQEAMAVPADKLPAAPTAKTAYAQCLTFSGATAFTLALDVNDSRAPTPKLQWSTDKVNWTDWDYSAVGGGCMLYLRGIGNTAFAERPNANDAVCFRFFVLTGSGVSCSGNVETLLDCQSVAAGDHPAMGAYAFYALFKDCTALVSLPDLPATALTEGCYQYMFDHCRNVKINATGSGQAWSLPVDAVKATNSTANMFYMTGGDFTGEPVAGTTYYVASATKTVQVAPQTVEHATVGVFVGEAEIAKSGATYPVPENATVRVVYVADVDWEFAEDVGTVTIEIVADQDENAVPADKVPTAVEKTVCNDCLAFTSASAFTLALAKDAQNEITPNFQWSTDKKNWTAWNFAAVAAATVDGGHALYLRGTNNTAFVANDAFPAMFVLNGNGVSCSGNVETLLDWKTVRAGSHPTMGKYAFCALFKNCAALVAMPELPATVLAEGCYEAMFENCTALTALPTLPATDLPNRCYFAMFKGCSRLAVNSAEPGVAWSLPAGGTVGEYSLMGMFQDTGSDLIVSGSGISTGVTYYVYSAQPYVTVTPQTLDHATAKVYVGEREIAGTDGSYAVRSNETVTVVYVADAGYEFAGFVPSATMTFTADKPTNIVPENLLPAAPTVKQTNANCIAFTSAEPFTVALAKGSNCKAAYAFEWSTNRVDWTAWNLAAIDAAQTADGYALYFRGSGNTTFASDAATGYFSKFVLTGSRIACSGNIETLLDWETVKNGDHPAMGEACFFHLFENCTALVAAPELPATTLAEYCYCGMFQGCTALTALPAFPAKTLADFCYEAMFMDCTGIVVNEAAPGIAFSLPAGGDAYVKDMLAGTCGTFTGMPVRGTTYYVYSALPFVTVAPNPVALATCKVSVGEREIVPVDGVYTVRSNETVTIVYSLGAGYEFSEGVSTAEVTLVADKTENAVPADQVPQPQAKTICEDCVTFSGDREFWLKVFSYGYAPEVSLEWSTNRIDWSKVVLGTNNRSFQTSDGYVLYLRGSGNRTFAKNYSVSDFEIANVSVDTDAAACSGNVETLLDWKTVNQGQRPPMDGYAFCEFFDSSCTLVDASQLTLPATNLNAHCFRWMFNGCNSLTSAPALPATTLASDCYAGMFQGCTHLTAAPLLPATNLAVRCYQNMFNGCSALAAAPLLPARTLAYKCYENMFEGCTALVTAPALPATTLAEDCYAGLFKDCTALKDIPSITAAQTPANCCKGMFQGCTALEVNLDGDGLTWQVAAFTGNNFSWNVDMFKGTAGTLADANDSTDSGVARAPFGNVVYYVKSAPWAKVVPQTIEHTTVSVYRGLEMEAIPLHAGGYTVRSNDVVTVVYTATDGAKFLGLSERAVARFFAVEQVGGVPESMLPAAPKFACRDCLTFTSEKAFSVALSVDAKAVKPSLERSFDLYDWTAWDGAATDVAAGKSFYVRGTGNKTLGDTAFQCVQFKLTGAGVRCYGNVETLLDWQTVAAGGHPQMAAACFAFLFKDCTALVEIPTLPATTLSTYCYYSMFEGCSALEVNADGEGLAWAIPAEAVTALDWNKDMLARTAGGFTGAPEAGEVYRIAGVPLVSVTLAADAVAHATGRVFAFGLETAASGDVYEVRSNAVLRIVYTAEDDYAFADGSDTCAVTYVADCTAAVPADVLPAAPAQLCSDCVVFSSAQPFTLAFRKGWGVSNVNLEWSTDRTHWTAWTLPAGLEVATNAPVVAVQTASGGYVLYLRGNDTYAFANVGNLPNYGPTHTEFASSFVISGTGVACYGNAETLLDWDMVRRGHHPRMYDYAFYRLFADNPALVSMPTLPAFAVESHCYCQMFDGCANLVISTLSGGMAWALPAYVAWWENYDPAYDDYRGEGQDPDANAPGWREDLFRATSLEAGLTSTPATGVTYRVTSAVATFAPQTLPHATFRQSKTTGFLGDVVTVEYFADKGYQFADGATNATVSFTMDQVLCPVPDELLPAAPAWAFDDVITFTSGKPFAVNFTVVESALSGSDCSLEWSTNRNDWLTWDANASVAAAANGAGYALYARGSGITAFARSSDYEKAPRFAIAAVGNVSCSGNVETLLDWQTVFAGGHPQMGEYAFTGLFRNNQCLVSIPDVKSEQLTDLCYGYMFYGCSGLVINTNGCGVAWSIPAKAAECDPALTNWRAYMFRGVQGTIGEAAAAPVPGVVYRVAGAAATVTPQAIEHATHKVYVGETEIYSPYPVAFGDTATVVYKVQKGYSFADGETTARVTYQVTDRYENVIPVDSLPAVVADGLLIEPGVEQTYATEAEARYMAANGCVVRPEAVKSVVSAADYAAMFKLDALWKDSAWKVVSSLTPATTNAVQQALDAASVAESLVATVTDETPSATVVTVPGLYYGLAGAGDLESLDAAVPSAWILGTGAAQTISGQQPENAEDKAFFRLRVEINP